MVPFLDVTKDIGGLQLVPRSHTEQVQEEIRLETSQHSFSRDFVNVSDEKYKPDALVVEAKAGDLILWDSRVIHGSQPGPSLLEGGDRAGGLARCSGLVCMTPRARASQEVLDHRLRGFQSGEGFSHWPHEAASTGLANTDGRNITWRRGDYRPLDLTSSQRMVL